MTNLDVMSTIEPVSSKEFVDNFDEMNLKKELCRYGVKKPSAIQQSTILPCLKGHDDIAHAQSGTGNTTNYIISILQQIDINLNECQAFILIPKRIMALNIQKEVIALGHFMKIRCHICIGGTNIYDDVRKLTTGFHVVVGTPGRLSDLISKKLFQAQFIKMLVLDNADEIMSPCFKDQIKKVFNFLKEDIQVIMVTTIMPDYILEVSTYFTHNPVRILWQKAPTLEDIKQFYVDVTMKVKKFDILCDLFNTLTTTTAVIFCNTPMKVEWLVKNISLKLKIDTVSALHGEIDQHVQNLVKSKFCLGSCRILITTDFFAQNICMHPKSVIVNYDFPFKINYINRIGCNSFSINSSSDHFVWKGVVISFIATKADKKAMKRIEKKYNTCILKMPQNITNVLLT